MKNNIAYIILLICLLANVPASFAQETRVTGTLKVHPWINLPVVISTDVKGGLQSLGTLNLTATPITVLNATVPDFKREIGMVTTTIDADNGNKTRYFEYIGADNWSEIFVIYGWQANHVYTVGEYVEYLGNFYIANQTQTSSATFVADALKWDNAGGKDGKYTIKEIKMDGQTLNKVAISTSVVAAGTEDNTLVTAGYASNAPFNGNRAVTRAGLTGISGVNFGTATIAAFLNSVFFPVLSPLVSYFRYQDNMTAGNYSYQTEDANRLLIPHVGTVTLGYLEYLGLTNLVFKYNINKRDPSRAISKVELVTNSGTLLGTIADGLVTGTFTFPKSNYTGLTLKVYDDASNITTLDITTSFTLANGVTISNAKISLSAGGAALVGTEGSGTSGDPYLIERPATTGGINLHLSWTNNYNDDINHVTNIDFTGSPALTNITGTNITQVDYTPVVFSNEDAPVAAGTIYKYGVKAKGSVANTYSAESPTFYYQMKEKTYLGFLTTNAEPSPADILGLQTKSLKTTDYYSGVTVTNNLSPAASGFCVWAVPTYGVAGYTQKMWSFAAGVWNQISVNKDEYYVEVTPNNWYWVGIYRASTASGNSVTVKLSN